MSVCGHNSHCSEDSSVCYTDSDEHTHDVASFRHQTIIIQGVLLLEYVYINSYTMYLCTLIFICIFMYGSIATCMTAY